jgi:hypothetical protein
MKEPDRFPELDEAIVAHARAVCRGDLRNAEAFAADAALAAYRAVFTGGQAASPADFAELGRARIGFQFVSKMRFTLGERNLTALLRWRREDDGKWRIADVEDLSGKRSPWSDIPPPATRTENNNA